MLIRAEEPKDYSAVHMVNAAAFETPAEAELVEALRKQAYPVISLVAEEQGEIVGHVLFSPVTLTGYADLKIMGLAPMAVLPRCQGKGIGTALGETGLQACKDLDYGAVVVLGHTWFYPKFGFVPAGHYGIRCEYDAPPEAFMVIELLSGYLEGKGGTIKYHPAFNEI